MRVDDVGYFISVILLFLLVGLSVAYSWAQILGLDVVADFIRNVMIMITIIVAVILMIVIITYYIIKIMLVLRGLIKNVKKPIL